MIVAFDNSILSLALKPGQEAPIDPATRQPLVRAKERVDALIDSLGAKSDVLIIPTPVLAETLCIVPDLQRALERLNRSSAVELMSFDERAAIELADVERQAVADGTYAVNGVPKQKAKFDRQIVMTAKVNGAERLYTDDGNMTKFATRVGLTVVHSWQLPLPPPQQVSMDLPT